MCNMFNCTCGCWEWLKVLIRIDLTSTFNQDIFVKKEKKDLKKILLHFPFTHDAGVNFLCLLSINPFWKIGILIHDKLKLILLL